MEGKYKLISWLVINKLIHIGFKVTHVLLTKEKPFYFYIGNIENYRYQSYLVDLIETFNKELHTLTIDEIPKNVEKNLALYKIILKNTKKDLLTLEQFEKKHPFEILQEATPTSNAVYQNKGFYYLNECYKSYYDFLNGLINLITKYQKLISYFKRNNKNKNTLEIASKELRKSRKSLKTLHNAIYDHNKFIDTKWGVFIKILESGKREGTRIKWKESQSLFKCFSLEFKKAFDIKSSIYNFAHYTFEFRIKTSDKYETLTAKQLRELKEESAGKKKIENLKEIFKNI